MGEEGGGKGVMYDGDGGSDEQACESDANARSRWNPSLEAIGEEA